MPAKKVVKPADFYKGQTVKYIIASRVGSGTDTVGRMMAPYFQEYTGATMAVENQEKVGSLEGWNYVYNKAKPDGLTFAIGATGAAVPIGSY